MHYPDFTKSSEYQSAKHKFGGHPTDFDLGPTPWHVLDDGLLINPAHPTKAINSSHLLDLFDPELGVSVIAYRTMTNLELPPSVSNTRHRQRGFLLSRLQAVLEVVNPKTVEEKTRWKRTVRPMTLPEMVNNSSGFHQTVGNEQAHSSSMSDPDIILRLPSFTNRATTGPITDLYALYLRKFHAYDEKLPLPSDPDALLKESRVQYGRWFDESRIVADLKFATPTRPDARPLSVVEDNSETFRSGPGGNYGSPNLELFGDVGRSTLGVVGDIAYWLLIDWIADKIRGRD